MLEKPKQLLGLQHRQEYIQIRSQGGGNLLKSPEIFKMRRPWKDTYLGFSAFRVFFSSSQSSLFLPLKQQFIWTIFLRVTYLRTFSRSTPALQRSAALVKARW